MEPRPQSERAEEKGADRLLGKVALITAPAARPNSAL